MTYSQSLYYFQLLQLTTDLIFPSFTFGKTRITVSTRCKSDSTIGCMFFQYTVWENSRKLSSPCLLSTFHSWCYNKCLKCSPLNLNKFLPSLVIVKTDILSALQSFYTYCILSHIASSLHTSQVVRGTSRTGGGMQFCRGSWAGSAGEPGWRAGESRSAGGAAGSRSRLGTASKVQGGFRAGQRISDPCPCMSFSAPQKTGSLTLLLLHKKTASALPSTFTLLPLHWGAGVGVGGESCQEPGFPFLLPSTSFLPFCLRLGRDLCLEITRLVKKGKARRSESASVWSIAVAGGGSWGRAVCI